LVGIQIRKKCDVLAQGLIGYYWEEKNNSSLGSSSRRNEKFKHARKGAI
jgi:hypothetical protein